MITAGFSNQQILYCLQTQSYQLILQFRVSKKKKGGGQIGNILGIMGHTIFGSTKLCSCSPKAGINNVQMNKHGYVPT